MKLGDFAWRSCDNCFVGYVMHESWLLGKVTRLCCKCHVQAGNPPVDWHTDCMLTYEKRKRRVTHR